MNVKELIYSDYYRYHAGVRQNFIKRNQELIGFKYTKVLRKAHYWRDKNRLMFCFYGYRLQKLQLRYGFQIPASTKIGRGLFLGHFGEIIVSSEARLGDNVNLSPNVVIGRENRGKNEGAPSIGNSVWIGSGAVVVGKITIGDDVLIAPNAFVNFDVPPHSVVIGNPAVVHHRENATDGYIDNKV